MTLRIAFLAHTKDPQRFLQDPAFIYRCENPALALRAQGHQVDLLHYTQFPHVFHSLFTAKKQYDIVVFHRPRWRFGFATLIRSLRQRGVFCIADFDDLVFDTQYINYSPGVMNGLVSPAQTRKNFLSHQRALLQFEGHHCAVTVSTEPLAEKVAQLFAQRNQPPAQIKTIFNQVHWHWQTTATAAKPTTPRLTYFPGTRSHDQDFSLIIPALSRCLAELPDWQLHITGILHPDTLARLVDAMQASGASPEQQLVCHPKQVFQEYRQHVAASWINLAPLTATIFNFHKSALKAIEASHFGAKTIATDIPDMQRLAPDACTLVAATNPEQVEIWYKTLKTAMLETSLAELYDRSVRVQAKSAKNVQQHAEQLLTIAQQGLNA